MFGTKSINHSGTNTNTNVNYSISAFFECLYFSYRSII